jgi:hypothetical protein
MTEATTTLTRAERHVARWPSANASDPDIRAFVDWLEAEAAQTLAGVKPFLAGHRSLLRTAGNRV